MPPLPDRALRVLLVGCGDLGSRIAHRLLAAGNTVYTLTRRLPAVAGVRPLLGDVSALASLPELPLDLDWVVYCLTPAARDEDHYRLAYPQGLGNVMTALGTATPGIAFVSSTAVYGAADGAWLDENGVTVPAGFNGRVLLEAEALALGRTQGMVFRLGGIYGPGRESLIRAVVESRPAAPSALEWGNRIHVDDAAAAICHLLGTGAHGVFNLVDSLPASTFEVMRVIALTMQREAPVCPDWDGVVRGRRISNRRLLASGFAFRYPDYRAGYQALLPQPMA